MAIENKIVSALVDAGADAMDNMYDVSIVFPWDSNNVVVTTRAEGFEPPAVEVGTYEVQYHGEKISLPDTEAKFDRSFKITFRLDASYNLWGKFKTWLAAVKDCVSGGGANWPGVLGSVSCTALAGAYIATGMPGIGSSGDGTVTSASNKANWSYNNVYVTKVGEPSFKTEGGKSMSYDVEFKFFDVAHMPFMNGKALTA
jgi:hypothetical protein